jgi:hypothetical protein
MVQYYSKMLSTLNFIHLWAFYHDYRGHCNFIFLLYFVSYLIQMFCILFLSKRTSREWYRWHNIIYHATLAITKFFYLMVVVHYFELVAEKGMHSWTSNLLVAIYLIENSNLLYIYLLNKSIIGRRMLYVLLSACLVTQFLFIEQRVSSVALLIIYLVDVSKDLCFLWYGDYRINRMANRQILPYYLLIFVIYIFWKVPSILHVCVPFLMVLYPMIQ